MSRRRGVAVRLALLVVLLAVAGVLGVRAVRRVERLRAAQTACDAVARRDWPAALAASEGLVGPDSAGRQAASCRCLALAETGKRGECADLLEELIADPRTGDWLPPPMLTVLVADARETRGDLPGAAELAHRGAEAYPQSYPLLVQELILRSRTEDEGAVLQEMSHRLDQAGAAAPRLRLRIAQRYSAREQWSEALDMLGPSPDAFPPGMRNDWYYVDVSALAGAGKTEALAAAFDAWRKAGGDPYELRALHALLMSSRELDDPKHPALPMLKQVVAEADKLDNETLLKGAYVRLIGTLAVAGRHQEALDYYDQGVEALGDLYPLTREELLRSATFEALGERGLESLRGRLRLRLAERRPGDVLWLSPDSDQPEDEGYERHPVPPAGTVEVSRAVGSWPHHWVLRDGQDRVAGSGTIWATPKHTVEVDLERRAPETPEPAFDGRRLPADGRPRVFQVILDCGDWRFVQYGRARREMPFFDSAIERGRRAVLESIPAYTAVAMDKLLHPTKHGVRSFSELLYQLGGEIQGLNFVGKNPFAALSWVVPPRENLFETLAGSGHETVNMLRSFGAMQLGRQAEVVGPGDHREMVGGYRASRELTPAELGLIGQVDDTQRDLLEEMAADFDALVKLARGSDADYVAARVASLDLMTHGLFSEVSRSGQDDGGATLYRVYRYIDSRLEELGHALDGDDLLVVMSDHGIRTAMEHDPRAMFLAIGAGVPHGRIEGTPKIRGVSRMVADYLGVATDWPATGIGPWKPAPAAGGRPAAGPPAPGG